MTETVDLKTQVDDLRRRAAQARDAAVLQALLDEARGVVQAAFQTAAEADSRELFRELRDRLQNASPAPEAASATKLERLQARLLAEQTRLRSGTQADVPRVVTALAQVLRELTASSRDTELRRTALDLIGQAAARSSEMRARVLTVLAEPEIAALPGVKSAVSKLESLPVTAQNGAGWRLEHLATQSRRIFYAGDYLEAADLLHEILKHDPEHDEARARLAQVEDYLRRGVVPDSRVPFEARAAFGRGQSLERAGRFEEARAAYQQALEAARAGGPLLQNWQPAVEAAMRVDNSLIAREMRDAADRLLRADDWPAATEQYQAVLRLLPDDGHAAERLQLIQTVQTKAASVWADGGDPLQRSRDAAEVLAAVRDLQRIAPGCKSVEIVQQEIAPVVAPLREALVVRSNELAEQAGLLSNIDDRRRLLRQAIELLETAQQLAPGGDLASRTQAVRFRLNALDQVDESLDEIERLLQLNTVAARRQAAELLRDLWGYSQDERYLRSLRSLQGQHVDRAREALQARRWPVAEGELVAARADIFGILDQADETWKLERQLRRARRAPWMRLAALGGLLVGIVLVVMLFANPIQQFAAGLVAAPATPIAPATAPPTVAPVPTDAPTEAPTTVPSPAPSATPLPTSTNPPTASPTPAATATDAPRYGAVNSESAARLSPDALAPWAFTLRLADPVQVLDEVYDVDGRLWYKIRYVRGDSELVGWAQARDINVSP